MPLLNACSQVELRSDIKEFVASFSLADSIEAYKEAGYTSEKETKINGVLFTEKIDFYFNIKDWNNPEYQVTTISKNGKEDENISKKFLEVIDTKFYLNDNGVRSDEYSRLQVEELIRPFFYKDVELSGGYHSGGMYYGDLIMETVGDLQTFVTIDKENSLYQFSHVVTQEVESGSITATTIYSVNKLGMLTKNISKMESGSDYLHQEINVYSVE